MEISNIVYGNGNRKAKYHYAKSNNALLSCFADGAV
jgi:hypothetical protein